jgi:prepilin-type N-terminal cleavage/methylation domain-containing protein
MWAKHKHQSAFTIVELLIVIIVIGILATIAIVAYSNFQRRAQQAALTSDVRQAITQLEIVKNDTGSYPATATDLKASPGTIYDYVTVNNEYCLTASSSVGSMYASSSQPGKVGGGPCAAASWAFNGNTSDGSLNGNDATTSTGVTLTTDRNGNADSAYLFDGSGSFVLISDSPSIDISGNQITMAAWVKPSATIGANNILSKRNGSNVGGYILHNNATNMLLAYVYTTSWQGVTSTSPVYSIGVWVHVAAVYDGSTFKIYANGVEVGSRSLTGNINSINSPLTIGGNGGTQSWPGSIDDVRIYDRALSDSDIKLLAQ